MEHGLLAKSPRIEVVDALRGFAVMAIMLLHNIEHFNFYDFPTASSAFMEAMDRGIWETLFFLFSGKAYAIFSLLFGFSFFIQYNNQAKKGKDFRLRFLWRLFLLFIIGCFNGAFFPGDILVLYSIIGVVLVLVCRWSDRAVLIAAIILMLQPLELGKFFYAMMNPDYEPAFGVFIANVCIRSFRSRISGRWSSPTFGTASCSVCCGHGGTDVFSRLPLCSCWVC